MPPEIISGLLPSDLLLDTSEGNAWVSLAAFDVDKMRVHYLPPFPYISNFKEINVRTYVTHNGVPGIYMFSITWCLNNWNQFSTGFRLVVAPRWKNSKNLAPRHQWADQDSQQNLLPYTCNLLQTMPVMLLVRSMVPVVEKAILSKNLF